MANLIDKVLAIDVETSGFDNGADVTRNHQIVSIGLIVATDKLQVVDEFYCEIKPNGTAHWNGRAEQVHGLSREYLNEHGLTEEDAVVAIASFILKYYEIDESIIFLGHNARTFDIPFFNKLMNKYDVEFKIARRAIDSFGVGFVTMGTNDSNELFSCFYPDRTTHNALEDARMALGVCRKIRKLFDKMVNA